MKVYYIISATDSANCAVYYIADSHPARMVRTAFSLATRFETKQNAERSLYRAATHWLGLAKWRLIRVTE